MGHNSPHSTVASQIVITTSIAQASLLWKHADIHTRSCRIAIHGCTHLMEKLYELCVLFGSYTLLEHGRIIAV